LEAKATNKPVKIRIKGKRTNNHAKNVAPPLQMTFKSQVQKRMKTNFIKIIVIIVPLVQPAPSQKMLTPLNKKITAIAKITTEKMKYMYEGIHNLLSISIIFAILYIMCGFFL
jgi:hypothetical protein